MTLDIEPKLNAILKGAQEHKPGVPYDAVGSELDVGELMWRGLIEPCLQGRPDLVTGGQLSFVLTPHGRNAKNASARERTVVDELLPWLVLLRRRNRGEDT